ncbi:acyltransferase family protein [Photobacterium ganghwense]|uniref:acyltransferase family protein n=1 Tax=Photobacterium ganghwense TaxID=320778 RepID=UPI004055C1AB
MGNIILVGEKRAEIMNYTEKKYLKSLNWFRGIAIIFVVLTHVYPISFSDDTAYVVFSVFNNGTFYFVFIAGYLFWHLKDRFEYKTYLRKKIDFVVLPYIFVYLSVLILVSIASNFYELPWVVNILEPLKQEGIVWHMLVGGKGPNPPMWFIPMICIFFIMSSWIYKLSESKIFYFVFIVSLSFSVFSFRGPENIYPVYSFFHYLGVYLFGIACKKNERVIFDKASVMVTPMLVLYLIFTYVDVVTGFGAEKHVFFSIPTDISDIIVNYNQASKVFGALFFLSLFFLIEKKNEKADFKILNTLAEYSFGIFFIHWYWILVTREITKRLEFTQYNGIEFYIMVILTFSMSIISIKLLKRITGKKSRQFCGC